MSGSPSVTRTVTNFSIRYSVLRPSRAVTKSFTAAYAGRRLLRRLWCGLPDHPSPTLSRARASSPRTASVRAAPRRFADAHRRGSIRRRLRRRGDSRTSPSFLLEGLYNFGPITASQCSDKARGGYQSAALEMSIPRGGLPPPPLAGPAAPVGPVVRQPSQAVTWTWPRGVSRLAPRA
jgi:hypothetical protein